MNSRRPEGVSEVVLWVGPLAVDPRLESSGFTVARISQHDLAEMRIESAPLFVVLDPQDRVRYAGGYTDRKQGPSIDDLRIVEEARGAGAPSPLPIFGCAISDRLRRELAALPTP